MSSSLSINKHLTSKGTWQISANIVPGGTLPLEIFLHENTGTSLLGSYQGVCSLSELQSTNVFTGTPIPKFGNRFVRSSSAQVEIPLDADVSIFTNHLIGSVKALSTSISAVISSTQIISIP